MRIRFGADRLAAEPALIGETVGVGLVTNDAARTSLRRELTTRAALQRAGVPLARLFTPEHGLSAAAPDGAAVCDGRDAVTGLPVSSLYGARLAPDPEALAGLDGVLFDVPDAGARFYTYAWTLTHVIDACAEAGLPVWVLDRPNPLGGAAHTVEGPLLEPAHASFLGRLEIPVRHSLTLGELALLWRRERRPAADVRVVACEGWQRDALWHDIGLPFVAPSPAITTPDAALLYPGLALLEATNVGVGRGSPLSFRAAAAPWLDARAVVAALARRRPDGVRAVVDHVVPSVAPHAGAACAAVRLHVIEPARVRPVALGLALLATIAQLHPDDFEWSGYPTAANPSGAGHLERLIGSGAVAATLRDAPETVSDSLIRDWVAAPGWDERRQAVLLYD